MIGINEAFSPSYARARVKFLEGAAAAGMAIRSYEHPLNRLLKYPTLKPPPSVQ